MNKKTRDESSYQKLMPLNWDSLKFTEKVDHVLKVQHEGFREYILSKDKKLRDYYNNLSEKKDRRIKLYITLFTVSLKDCSKESRKILKDFVRALNDLGRAKLQYVECSDPDVIEVREIR